MPPSKASRRNPESTNFAPSSAKAVARSSGSASKVDENAGANRYSAASSPTMRARPRGEILAVDRRGALRVIRIEAAAVAHDLEEQPRQAQLRAGAEQPRARERDERAVVARVQHAVAQDRVAGLRERVQPRAQPERVDHALHVAIAARDELRAAIDHEVAARRRDPLAAHAPAGDGLALEHLDLVAGAAQSPRTGQPRNASAHHDDRGHRSQLRDSG